MKRLETIILFCLLLVSFTTFANNVNCGVTTSTSNGTITVNGMDANSNTKLFTSDFAAVWDCNPWQGTPCSANEVITGLTVGTTYYLSIQSDVCNEWIPITVEGGGNSSTITLTCPDDILVGVPQGSNGVNVNWTPPSSSYSNCPGNASQSIVNQISGPENGAFLTAGSYTVSYNVTNGCNATDECSFNITVDPNISLSDCGFEGFISDCIYNSVTTEYTLQVNSPFEGIYLVSLYGASEGWFVKQHNYNQPYTVTEIPFPGETHKFIQDLNDPNCILLVPGVCNQNNCNISGTVSNCISGTNPSFINSVSYDLYVSGPVGGSFLTPITQNGTQMQQFTYNETHSVTETTIPSEKSIQDIADASCTTVVPMTCTPVAGCNVDYFVTASGDINLTGLSASNTKLFDENINEVWNCNPWQGNPCSANETISGLADGTYFISIQSDDCDEWIPVTVSGSVDVCELNATIIQCNYEYPGNAVYQILVTGTNTASDEFRMGTFDPVNGLVYNNYEYGVVHNVTDWSSPQNYTKAIEDSVDPSCTTTFAIDCVIPNSDITFTSCPSDFTAIAGQPITWTEPDYDDNCGSGGGQIGFNQTGPNNGDVLSAGTYDVNYTISNLCGSIDNCNFTITVNEEPQGCTVSAISNNGNIEITGLGADVNAKLFDADFNAAFECNPWNGNPCSNLEVATGLNPGETYYLSVVSDNCDEWIPVTVEPGSGNCNIEATLSNCAQSTNGSFITYDLFVSGPIGGTFLMQVASPGLIDIELAYNETHTRTDFFDNPVQRTIRDSEDESCTTTVSAPCTLYPFDECSIEATVTNCISGTNPNFINSVSYDLFVAGPVGGSFLTPITQNGTQMQQFTYNETHSITETTIPSGKSIQDIADPDCTTSVAMTCTPIGGCNVNYFVGATGEINITGLGTANTKLFDANIVEVWNCNPWQGNPCAANETITGLAAGTYFLSVQSDDCNEWISITVTGQLPDSFDRLGTAKLGNSINIQSVFPNPAYQEAFVRVESKFNEEFTMDIYDTLGSLQQRTTVNIEEGNNTIELDLNNLDAGIYNLFLINNKGQTKSVRFVKIRA